MAYRHKGKKILQEHNLLFANLNCGHHFKGQGSSFSWWLALNEPPSFDTKFVTAEGECFLRLDSLQILPAKCLSRIAVDIHRKALDKSAFTIHWQGHKRDVSSVRTEEYKWRAYNTKAQPEVWLKEDRFTAVKKVILQSVSNFAPLYDDGTIGVARQSGFIEVETQEEGENLVSFLSSKLMRFIFWSVKMDGFNSVRHIPQVDLSKPLPDKDIYAIFNLTEEEIAFIELHS